MELDRLIKDLTWKKVVLGIIALIVSTTVIRGVFFITILHGFYKMFTQFNEQFDANQQYIRKKIEKDADELDKWGKEFDKGFDEFHQEVEERFKESEESMKKIDDEREKREAQFDKHFMDFDENRRMVENAGANSSLNEPNKK